MVNFWKKNICHVLSVYFTDQKPKFNILCSLQDTMMKLIVVIHIDKTNGTRAKKIQNGDKIVYFTDQILFSNIWSVKCT